MNKYFYKRMHVYDIIHLLNNRIPEYNVKYNVGICFTYIHDSEQYNKRVN